MGIGLSKTGAASNALEHQLGGLEVTKEDLEALWVRYDANQDGVLSIEELTDMKLDLYAVMKGKLRQSAIKAKEVSSNAPPKMRKMLLDLAKMPFEIMEKCVDESAASLKEKPQDHFKKYVVVFQH